MDLYAYANICNLKELAEVNGIDVPRLRGYRLMSEEEKIPNDKILRVCKEHELYLCEQACRCPDMNPFSNSSEYSWRTDLIKKKYVITKAVTKVQRDGTTYRYDETIGFRWSLLHGKRRKNLKFAIKKGKRAARLQLETFNRYVGRDDVLYIHARIGGWNWLECGGDEVKKQPWFIEKVDDYFDNTYCDIYALVSRKSKT